MLTGEGPQTGRGSSGVVLPGRRRVPVAVSAVLAALAAALGFVLLWVGADDARPVLALARPVPAGRLIAAEDLVIVRVAPQPALSPVSAADRGRVIGAPAAVDLVAGTLLTEAQLGSGALIGAGQTLVGAALDDSRLPPLTLARGDRVQVVQSLPSSTVSGAAAGRVLASARVFAIRPAEDAQAETLVELAVDARAAAAVAAAVAADQVSLVLVGSG